MKKIIMIVTISLCLIIGLKIFLRKQKMNPNPTDNIILTVIYDNNPFNQNLKTAWGFSCLIKAENKNILFDTGGNGTLLLENMEKLNIQPTQIDTVVISHIHGDHSAGLPTFLDKNPNVTVYLPKSFPQKYKDQVKRKGAQVVDVEKNATIFPNILSTGELGTFIKEQSLIIKNTKGLIIISGCAHPGIVEIIDESKKITGNDNIFLVIGGFHLFGQSKEKISEIVSEFKNRGVKYVGPCHCSGDIARQLFKEEYQQNYIDVGVGKIINLKELQ